MQEKAVILKAPFPWFGGKSSVAKLVWRRFGNVRNYVEPFFGSGAMLLGRPLPFEGTETINDADGFVSNFWRAIKHDPEQVAEHADWPVNENDLHARHVWLKGQGESIVSRLEGDPDWFDAKVAGWWVWGVACWIGGGWCGESSDGPWQSVEMPDGSRQLVHLGDAGQGVNRQRVHLGSAGQGVNRKRVHLGSAGQGVNRKRVDDLIRYFGLLADRLARVRVCCGDWTRVCGPTPTVKQGLTAVFLDPPYAAETDRDMRLYHGDEGTVAHDVRAWCLEHGDDPRMRVVLCGYEGEHEELERHGWTCEAWKARGGYGSQSTKHDNPNARRERLWFSPHCVPDRLPLFAGLED